MLDLLAIGYPSVDTILPVSQCPPANDLAILSVLPEDTPPTYGGCGANVAVGLCRLGYRTGLATLLGDDPPGNAYLAHLNTEGVDTRDVQLVPGKRSSHNFLMVAPDGEYQNFYYPGACPADWQGEIEFTAMTDARFALITAGPLHYCRAFNEVALHHDVPLFWQLKTSTATYPDEVLERFWKQSTIIMMNEGESIWLCERLGVSGPRDLLSASTEVAIVTQGAEGAKLWYEDEETHVPSFPLPETYAVGAGDAFTTGFLDGFLQQADWVECTRRGVTLATFALSQPGAHSGLPDRETYWKRHQEYWSQK